MGVWGCVLYQAGMQEQRGAVLMVMQHAQRAASCRLTCPFASHCSPCHTWLSSEMRL